MRFAVLVQNIPTNAQYLSQQAMYGIGRGLWYICVAFDYLEDSYQRRLHYEEGA
jgi:hypothetical protein